jgi:hypothetical protein
MSRNRAERRARELTAETGVVHYPFHAGRNRWQVRTRENQDSKVVEQ